MSGPFYFAWIDTPIPFDEGTHVRNDEDVLRFTMTHSEGEFPACSIEIENPRRGLLSGAYWAWLSWDKNWVRTEDHVPDIVPLFLGRLIGIPNAFNHQLITLEFTAKPRDYADQLDALADTLRVLPYYDPLWISPDKWTDPSVVLEGYTRLWHFDRLTHEVTTSDLLVGEDGIEEFHENEIPSDSVQTSIAQAPIRRVRVEGTATWTQRWVGGGINIAQGTIQTLFGGSIVSDWPKPDTNLGGGYIVKNSSIKPLNDAERIETSSFSMSWNNPSEKPTPGDTMSTSYSASIPNGNSVVDEWLLTTSSFTGFAKATVDSSTLYLIGWNLSYSLEVGFEVERGRTEVASFEMVSNIQPILSDPDETDIHEIKLSSNDVGEATFDESIPIGDVTRASFFETDRGQYALQYLMNVARAPLVAAARCVEVSCTIPFERAIELSCRKNAIINDFRLPGGSALGKIKQYTFNADGDTGEMIGTVTIACAIGYGESIEVVTGDPTYVEDGYVADGYQYRENATIVLPSGDFAYIPPVFDPNDDGLRWPLTKNDILLGTQWHIGSGETPVQPTAEDLSALEVPPEELHNFEAIAQASIKNAEKNPTWFEIRLRNLGGKFSAPYEVETIALEIPKQIDLEFEAS